MFRQIAYFLIFGKPLIFYLGISTFISFLSTAAIGLSIYKGWSKISLKTHFIFAMISIFLATVHGFLGMALFFNF